MIKHLPEVVLLCLTAFRRFLSATELKGCLDVAKLCNSSEHVRLSKMLLGLPLVLHPDCV